MVVDFESSARTVAATIRQCRRLLRLERQSPLAWTEPSLVIRGFLSERRWLYPGLTSDYRAFISDVEMKHLIFRLNPRVVRRVLTDKLRFHHVLRERGLGGAHPDIVGVVENGSLELLNETPTRGQFEGYIVKPRYGARGNGVRTARDLEVALNVARSWSGSWIVQGQVSHGSWARALSPGALPTIRMLTIRPTPRSSPFLAAAALRLGTRATAPVDNFSAGGLVAGIDIADGRLADAVQRPRTRSAVRFIRHPETGARIAGGAIPDWDALTALALEAMRRFPDAVHVGWDLHPSDKGPVLIEGNAAPNLNIYQAHGSILRHERLWRFYRSHGLPMRPCAWRPLTRDQSRRDGSDASSTSTGGGFGSSLE